MVGLLAYWVYKRQKDDFKKDAANIILLEIQSAERTIGQVRESVMEGNLPNKFLIPMGSWDKYKYLFVRDFDRDEWDTITSFYNYCKIYDEAVSANESLFQKNEEQIRANVLRAPAEYISEFLKSSETLPNEAPEKEIKKIYEKVGKFQKIYLSRMSDFVYEPQKYVRIGKSCLENIGTNLSQTSIGTQFKNLAGVKVRDL